MAMMAKMRSLAPAFIITVGALFVLFMIISDSNVLEALGGRPTNVGSVNGEDITYNEFMLALERQRENLRAQGQEIDEEQMDQFREQVWDALVTQKLVAEQLDKFGVTVSDAEIEDIILGPNPPDFLRQSFIDSTGRFNRELYDQALFDPRNKDALLQAEEFVRQNRLNEKLQSLLTASISVSEAEVKRSFIDQNTNMNASFALVEINLFPDDQIEVSDDDLKNYYNKNLDNYRMQAQRKLKYIMFSNTATADDSNSIRRDLENVAQSISNNDTLGFSKSVDIYSSVPYSRDTLGINTLSPEAAQALSDAAPGAIVGPVPSPEGFVLYNLVAKVPAAELSVRASHILINQAESEETNLEEANKLYNQLVAGADFASAARERSGDPGSAKQGGDLGWFGRGMMVKEFEDASFNGKIGEVQKPVKTSYGYHIVKVTGRSNNNFIVERIVRPVEVSATTRDANYNSANDFAYLSKKNGFEKEAEVLGYQINETPLFNKDALSIPGIGTNKRIVDFAFDNSVNNISDVYKVNNGYVVVKIAEATKEGVRSFDETKEQIRPIVIREKKFEKARQLADQIKSKINGNLDRVSEIDSRVSINQTGSFTPSGNIPNVGRDFAFSDKALNLELNKISDPVKGNRGYYLMKVTERAEFDQNMFAGQRNAITNNLLQEKKSMFFNQWLAKLKADANIQDNRHMFFGQ